jgi:putative tryptophan/tyrosine transport system substrate-binding protein
MVEYHWLNGRYDDLSELMADLVRCRVAVITTPASWPGVKAARAATATIPIVFSIGDDDPVRLGLVASFKHPGGNATGVNFFTYEAAGKQFDRLHQLAPKAVRVAVLINPAPGTSAECAVAWNWPPK